jgi:hypothetical protein
MINNLFIKMSANYTYIKAIFIGIGLTGIPFVIGLANK